MIIRSDAATHRTAFGHVQVYLGATSLDEVRRYRALFGGVTLQGSGGLRIARELHRANDLDGIDLDPAVYVNSQRTRDPQLCLDLETEPFDWLGAQRDLGLSVIRTAGHRIPAGDIDQIRVELAQPRAVRVSVELVLDGGWLSQRHIDSLEAELTTADRDVSLVLAGVFNPLDSMSKVSGLRRLLRWAWTSGRRLEVLRTDMAGVAATTEGACLAAVGLGTSTRHFGLPLPPKQRNEYEERQHSPLVFVPRLLHWQRGNVLGALAPWRGGGVTDCDCSACGAAGTDLLRFDVMCTVIPTEIKNAVREHDVLALAQIAADLMGSPDPRGRLGEMAKSAVHLARTVTSTFKVQLDPPPAWLSTWAQLT